MKLKILKKAPLDQIPPPRHSYYDNRPIHEKLCISGSAFWFDDTHAFKYRCSRHGTIETDKGWLCGNHARAWARRGWINPDLLRKILVKREKEKQKRAAQRKACLTKGRCI